MSYILRASFAVAVLIPSIVHAQDNINEFLHSSTNVQLAQNSNCEAAQRNAQICYKNWKNIGGGSNGQAGAFQQCMQQYCILLAGHSCDLPDFCK